MKRPSNHSVMRVGALVLACAVAGGQESGKGDLKGEVALLRATIEQLQAEVALLRKNVTRLELERQRDNVRQIKAELEALRAEHARLAELDRARQQDLHDIEALLNREDLATQERSEMETARADLAVERGREIDRQSEAARARESELVRRLETEEQSLKRLDEAWRLSGGKTQ